MDPLVESIETIERLGFELFGVVPGTVIRDDGSAIFFKIGAKSSLCNGVFRIRWTEDDAEHRIDRYIAEFAETGTPFMFHASDASTPKGLRELLRVRGLHPEPEASMFAMELTPDLESGPLPANMSLRRVSTQEDAAAYGAIFVDGFKLPELIAGEFRRFFEHYGCGEERNYQSLLLEAEGRPAAVVSILGPRDARGVRRGYPDLPDDLCTMMGLTVAPWARGRYLGFRIAREAVKFARACGYRRLCTTGTPEGMGIYRRAPLNEVGRAQRWSWVPG